MGESEGAALGEGGELGDRDLEVVHRHRHAGTVEVAGLDPLPVDQKRVVRHRVQLVANLDGGEAQGSPDRAHDLRGAADREGIGVAVGGGQRAAGQQLTQPAADETGTSVGAAEGAGIDAAGVGAHDLHGHRGRDDRRLHHPAGPHHRDCGKGGGQGDPVDQREGLLGGRCEGGQCIALVEVATRDRSDVGHRREVAGGTDAPLGGDPGGDVVVEHRQENPGCGSTAPAGTLGQNVDARGDGSPDHGVRERIADPGAVPDDERPGEGIVVHALGVISDEPAALLRQDRDSRRGCLGVAAHHPGVVGVDLNPSTQGDLVEQIRSEGLSVEQDHDGSSPS